MKRSRHTASIALGGLLIVETCVTFTGPYVAENLAGRVLVAKRSLANQPLRADVLVVGDSAAELGIDTRVLGDLSGLRCFSFATLGEIAAVEDGALLDRYLEANPPPKALLVSVSFDLWALTPANPRVLGAVGLVSPATLVTMPGFWINGPKLLRYALPSLRYRHELQRACGDAICAPSRLGDRWQVNRTLPERLKGELGNYRLFLEEANPNWFGASNPEQVRIDADTIRASENLQMSDFARQRAEALFERCRSLGVEVVYVWPPMWSPVAGRLSATPLYVSHRAWLEEAAVRFGNVRFLNPGYEATPTDHLLDAVDHLTREASAARSARLAPALVRLLGR